MNTLAISANVWLITDQLPAPPRNGITVPAFHYAQSLHAAGSLRLCLLDASDTGPSPDDLRANEALFGPIAVLRFTRRPIARRVADELTGREMYQHGWDVVDPPAQLLAELRSASAWLVSPMSAVAKLRSVAGAWRCHGRAPRRVAAVNDCTAAEYLYRSRTPGLSLPQRAKARLDRLRAPGIGRIEGRLFADYDAVAVQTPADREALLTLASPALDGSTVLLPNGVAPELLTVPATSEANVLFVAELSGEYRGTLLWLLRRIWPQVHQRQPTARLVVVGRGADDEVREQIAATPGVTHHAGVPSLLPCYTTSRVVWSPVFKGFGLINKSLEAMAAARAVIGGDRAFNGIDGFRHGEHGLAIGMGDEAGWIGETVRLLADVDAAHSLGLSARELIAERFEWTRTVRSLFEALGVSQPATPAVDSPSGSHHG